MPHWRLGLGVVLVLDLQAYFFFFLYTNQIIQSHMKLPPSEVLTYSHEIRLNHFAIDNVPKEWFYQIYNTSGDSVSSEDNLTGCSPHTDFILSTC